MLPAKSRDPQVIGRNRLTRALQFQPDGRVVPRSLNANIKDCIGPAFAAGIFRKPRGGVIGRFQKQTPRLRLRESQARAPRTQSQLLPAFCPDKRKGHSCPESSPVLGLDLFKFLVDDLLYPQRLFVEMGQFARTFQPGLARRATSVGELFFDCLRHVLAQGNSQCTGGGLGLAEGGVRDFQRSLHNTSLPYLWDSRTPGFVLQSELTGAVEGGVQSGGEEAGHGEMLRSFRVAGRFAAGSDWHADLGDFE